eukprot:scaffold49829_cov208-Isochrysis_galbana.AAC.1
MKSALTAACDIFNVIINQPVGGGVRLSVGGRRADGTDVRCTSHSVSSSSPKGKVGGAREDNS